RGRWGGPPAMPAGGRRPVHGREPWWETVLHLLRKYRALLFATALLFSGLVILTSTHEHRRDLGLLDRVALDVAAGLARGVAYGLGAVERLWSGYVALLGVRAENAALREEIARLKLRQAELAEAAAEAERLRRLLGLRERAGFSGVVATVIAVDASGWFRTVTIDRGSADGLERGLAVVTPDGVVGRTQAVASRAAKVLLITDPNSAVDALVQRSRARGVVAGRLGPELEMRYVHRTEDVQVGDLVVTSGVGGVFPKGLPIGVVSAVRKTTGLFQSVEVTPAVDLSKLEEVLVVTGVAQPPRELLEEPGAAARRGTGPEGGRR
ncbi:MAG TPA: rod shape-determining protein MreC, partial [Thermodesulfobacteriota bacterium]|nr:rod shape-determining protein MreC [Thermodesulfobacteriota bacterium]